MSADQVSAPLPPPARVGAEQPAAPVLNVANYLTIARIALVPVFVALFFVDGAHSSGWRVAAWAAFAIASVTDRIDGDIARRRGLVTDFGKVADPIADKALIGAALVSLSIVDELPWWVTVVILAREVGVTGLRFWVIRLGVIPASRGGKVKTLLQGIGLGLYVLPLSGWLHDVAVGVMAVALVVTLVTGGDYVFRALAVRRAGRA
ncbi:MAG: CDP-diacylglycerol---glycerol-3-phosphate 3-phosphatidyltransferase [Frankiales bacterium]|jgi:CDP-diacylglycerol--glycerol-3-phosphate 3-phosphatidyltransferase|nr:CDP-diacylglycerol---glycerol-3-phosphate 3-phosphatidyltransferase [Frankiales bacterium]MDX6244519.1 CDP-diacylglycerol---glycerol-3-phosphate 3-phosphatidyltransferase [Frankiales bacterium]